MDIYKEVTEIIKKKKKSIKVGDTVVFTKEARSGQIKVGDNKKHTLLGFVESDIIGQCVELSNYKPDVPYTERHPNCVSIYWLKKFKNK